MGRVRSGAFPSREGRVLSVYLGEALAWRGDWPTPTVRGNYNQRGVWEKSGDGLALAVKNLRPTPLARDHRSGRTSAAVAARIAEGQAEIDTVVKRVGVPANVPYGLTATSDGAFRLRVDMPVTWRKLC